MSVFWGWCVSHPTPPPRGHGGGRKGCRSNFAKPEPCVISGLLLWAFRNCHGMLLFSELFAMLLILAYSLLLILSFTVWSLMEKLI